MAYKTTGYWEADCTPKDTGVIRLLRVTRQDDVDPIEASAAIAGEASTAAWTSDTDGPPDGGRKGSRQVVPCRSVPATEGQSFAYIVYDGGLFEPGSIASLERERLDKFGHPLLGATVEPKPGLFGPQLRPRGL
jgi:ribulose 1,5-bisphosphate carboxylase large subunit-like protein